MNVVGFYDENGIIKGLTKDETLEYETLSIEKRQYIREDRKTIKDFILPPANSEAYKDYMRIKDRIIELEEKMEGIPLEEFEATEKIPPKEYKPETKAE